MSRSNPSTFAACSNTWSTSNVTAGETLVRSRREMA